MSDQKDKVTKVVTKEDVIKFLAQDLGMNIQPVRETYRLLEDRLMGMLSEADESKDVSIHIFEGVRLESKFIPKREKLDNLTGRRRIYEDKIAVKSSLSRRYMEKINRKKKSQ